MRGAWARCAGPRARLRVHHLPDHRCHSHRPRWPAQEWDTMRGQMSRCKGYVRAPLPWRLPADVRPDSPLPTRITSTAWDLSVPRSTVRTAPSPLTRRKPSERADAHTAGLGAGHIPAPTHSGVWLGRLGHGTTGNSRAGQTWSRLGSSTPPVKAVAPILSSRLPVLFLAKENAR